MTLHDILGPPEVQNNSRPYVLLDCDFSINVSEREGMILKWYLNGKTIYQWIPPRRPQVSISAHNCQHTINRSHIYFNGFHGFSLCFAIFCVQLYVYCVKVLIFDVWCLVT